MHTTLKIGLVSPLFVANMVCILDRYSYLLLWILSARSSARVPLLGTWQHPQHPHYSLPSNMELQKRLELEAKLTGNMLRLAIDVCSSNLVESVAVLREELDEGNLDSLFPQLVLIKVQKALDGQTFQRTDAQVTTTRASRPAAKNESKGTDLPAGRVYAAFISHKKVRDTYTRSVTKVP